MGKKHKRKKGYGNFDIEREEQQELLDKLNQALESADLDTFTEAESEFEDYENDNSFSNMIDRCVTDLLQEENDSENIDEYCSDINGIVDSLLSGDGLEDDDYEDRDEHDEYYEDSSCEQSNTPMIRHALTGVHVTLAKTYGTKILTISDFAKSIDIDLSLIPHDTFAIQMENMGPEEFLATALYGTLEEILPNFYPSAILTSEEADALFKNVSSYDETKFYFYRYPDDSGTIFMYYINQESLDTLDETMSDMIIQDCPYAFLVNMKDRTVEEGFSCKALPVEYMHQMALIDDYAAIKADIIQTFIEDDETVLSEDVVFDNIFDAAYVLPYDHIDERMDSIIRGNYESDAINIDSEEDELDPEEDDTDNDTEVETELHDDEMAINTKTEEVLKDIPGSDFFKGAELDGIQMKTSVTVSEEVQVTTATESLPEETNPDDLLDESELAEKQYFGKVFDNSSKPQKSHNNHNASSGDDMMMVQKRRI